MSTPTPRELKNAWEELHENLAWKQLIDVIHSQQHARVEETMRNVATPENMYDRERIRGEWAGLALLLEYAATLYEVAQQELEELTKEKADADNQAQAV